MSGDRRNDTGTGGVTHIGAMHIGQRRRRAKRRTQWEWRALSSGSLLRAAGGGAAKGRGKAVPLVGEP